PVGHPPRLRCADPRARALDRLPGAGRGGRGGRRRLRPVEHRHPRRGHAAARERLLHHAAALLRGRRDPAGDHPGATVLARSGAGGDRIAAELVGRPGAADGPRQGTGAHSGAWCRTGAVDARGWAARRSPGGLMARAKNTPNDPQRRERILAATMRILQEEGISAVRARAVAARAEVPLSSVSYRFPSWRERLLAASRCVAALRTEGLEAWSAQVTRGLIHRRLAEQIHEQITTGRELTDIAYELYLLGLRDEDFRSISL